MTRAVCEDVGNGEIVMHCAHCVKLRLFPRDFPHPLYAICRGCWEAWARPSAPVRFFRWVRSWFR